MERIMFDSAMETVFLDDRTKLVDIDALLAKRTTSEKMKDNRFLVTAKLSVLFGSGFLLYIVVLLSIAELWPTWAPSHPAWFVAFAIPFGLLAACSGFMGILCWCEMPEKREWDRMLAVKYLAREPR